MYFNFQILRQPSSSVECDDGLYIVVILVTRSALGESYERFMSSFSNKAIVWKIKYSLQG